MKKLLISLSLITTMSIPLLVNVSNNDLSNIKKNNQILFENRKENITSAKIKEVTVDFKNIADEESEAEIMKLVFGKILAENGEDELVIGIIYNMLFSSDDWDFLNIDFVKPEIGQVIKYEAMALAKPTNLEYIGVAKFDVTYVNTNEGYKDIEVLGEDEFIVDAKEDNQSRWVGQNGKVISINLDEYGLDKKRLLENYPSVTVTYNFKHEDNAYYGDGIIKEHLGYEVNIPINNEILNKSEWHYPNSITEGNAENIYDTNHENVEGAGVIQRYGHDYVQNKIWAFYAIDQIYNENSNTFSFRSTAIAGKYGHWANVVNVFSKVTTKISSIKLNVK